jgi:hypothetical protein
MRTAGVLLFHEVPDRFDIALDTWSSINHRHADFHPFVQLVVLSPMSTTAVMTRLSWALPIFLASHAAVFLVVGIQIMMLTPYDGDMVAWLDGYSAFKQNRDLFHYLLTPHNEHRLVTIRLLTAVDVEIFGGHRFAFIGAGLASVIGIIAIVLVELRRGGIALLSPGVVLAIALVLTVPMAVDCSIPANTLYPITLFFTISAIVLAIRSRVSAAIVAALLATFTNAIGLVVWPALLWVSIPRLRWPWLLGLAVTAVVVWVGFMLDTQQSQNYSAHSVWDAVSYWPSFVGLPWSRSLMLQVPSEILGVILIGAALALSARVPRTDELQTIAVAFVLFSLGCSVMAAAGRSGMHEPYPPIRYAIFMTPTHLALLFFALRRKWLLDSRAIVIIGVLVVQQAISGYMAVLTARSRGLSIGF